MIFNPIKTMKITDNIYSVKSKMVNLFIIKDGDSVICIDTGFGFDVKYGLRKLGIEPKTVSDVFLTHSDYDHAGNLKLFSEAKIHLSEDEEQMINGSTPRAMWIRYNKKIRRDYNLLRDGEVVMAGKIKVQGIATPGHTKGSMSYLINDSYLFAGDTMSLINSKVHTFPFFINMDTKTQKESIKKLSNIENVKMLFTAHSGYTTDFYSSVRKWMS